MSQTWQQNREKIVADIKRIDDRSATNRTAIQEHEKLCIKHHGEVLNAIDKVTSGNRYLLAIGMLILGALAKLLFFTH